MTIETHMHDVNALPPLIVLGVSFALEHRFAVVWSRGTTSSFPEWDQLKAHLREKGKSCDFDVTRATVFVCTKERMWMQVPHPGV